MIHDEHGMVVKGKPKHNIRMLKIRTKVSHFAPQIQYGLDRYRAIARDPRPTTKRLSHNTAKVPVSLSVLIIIIIIINKGITIVHKMLLS